MKGGLARIVGCAQEREEIGDGFLKLSGEIVWADALLAADAGGAGDEQRWVAVARIVDDGGAGEARGQRAVTSGVSKRRDLSGVFYGLPGMFEGEAVDDELITLMADAGSGGEALGEVIGSAEPFAEGCKAARRASIGSWIAGR